jgi:hypothetical protein
MRKASAGANKTTCSRMTKAAAAQNAEAIRPPQVGQPSAIISPSIMKKGPCQSFWIR